MSDLVDTANERAAEIVGDRESAIRRAAENIPAGTAGDCEYCGEWFSRLVEEACARCRDKFRLP